VSGHPYWLDFELHRYQDSLHHRVREAYGAAYDVLESAYRKQKEESENDLKASTDEEDRELDARIINYEKERWGEQQEALAAMALALLASLTKLFLDEAKGESLNKSHPREAKGYGGKGQSQLAKQVIEYKSRFGVDLEALKDFKTVREVELARHCCLHNEGMPTDDYLQHTKKRPLNERGNISLTPELLDSLINELSSFGDGLSAGMTENRKKANTVDEKDQD
jgi:hypothetical protein